VHGQHAAAADYCNDEDSGNGDKRLLARMRKVGKEVTGLVVAQLEL
jgi:hypothetical protein